MFGDEVGRREMRYPELPETCPSCGRQFSWLTYTYNRPNLTWSPGAVIVLLVGAFVGLAISALILIVGHLLVIGLATGVATAIGSVAYGMPRIVRIKCYKCGWAARLR